MADPGARVLSVVVPCYNERGTIRTILDRVASMPVVREIIVVDDGSTDGTREALSDLLAGWPGGSPSFRVYRHDKNRGKGAALRSGFRRVTGPITVVQDADLEYDPREYPKLIQPILDGDADVVYGSRFAGFPRRVLYYWHSLGNRLLTTLSNMMTNLNLTDMETGFKAFRSEILKSIPIRSDRFGFEPEITAKVARLGCRIFEVPIAYRGRSYSEGKKITWRDGVRALWPILKYRVVHDVGLPTGIMTLKLLEKATGYNRWVYELFRPFLGGEILEVGSGIGTMTRHLLSHGRVTASDVSPACLGELRRAFDGRPGVQVRPLDITRIDPSSKESYDSIVCLNVLEHVEEDGEALRQMHRLLRPGGRLILYVPANPRLYCEIDRGVGHYRRYHMGDLVSKLRGSGFRLLHQRHHNLLGAVGWWLRGKVFGTKTVAATDVGGFEMLLPVAKLQDRLETRFALSILAVGEKPEATSPSGTS